VEPILNQLQVVVVDGAGQDQGKQYLVEFADLEGGNMRSRTWRSRSCCRCTTNLLLFEKGVDRRLVRWRSLP
jgi:hypothetical protein